MRGKVLLVATLILAGSAFCGPTEVKHFDGKSWWELVKVLADDRMEGRGVGSEGLGRAQAYVVSQLMKVGLEPAGSDGFYQTVKFASRRILEEDSSLILVRDGKEERLTLGEDAAVSTRAEMVGGETTAALVFVGYGLKVPENNYDDTADVDLKGKIAVMLSGTPAGIPGPLAAHYGRLAERWKALHEAGAIGTFTIPNPASMDIPWNRMMGNRLQPSLDLAEVDFIDIQGRKVAGLFNPAKANKLFDGSGHTFEELAALGKERKPVPHFALKVQLKARVRMDTKEVTSANIVAKLPGSDPTLKNEYVVLSAHLDHLGMGEPINGDRIYNGAMDNGSGSALLLDMAASLKARPEKIRRSILFLFVTAEENGSLGSKYFATHPTVDGKALVADVNTDMFLPIVPMKVITVLGLADSDLGDRTREAAGAVGVKVQADQEPMRNLIVRSDQYSFIRQGVPSVAIDVGFEPGAPEEKIFKEWLTNRYHAPSDDTNQPVNLETAARYEEVVRQLMITTANASERPRWKSDSFFRRYANAVE